MRRFRWFSDVSPTALVLATAVLLLGTVPAGAAPYHTPTVDGAIPTDGTDWALNDMVHDDFADFDSGLLSGNVRDLWLTWDATHLTVGLRYQSASKSVLLYLDTGRDVGPSYADSLDAVPRRLEFPSDFRIDYVAAKSHASFADTAGSAAVWRVLDDIGSVETVSAVDYQDGFYSDATLAATDRRFGIWLASEMRIPWTEIYPDGMPAGAVIKAVAAVTVDADHEGAEDILPGDGRTSGQQPPIAVEAYHMSIVDQDGDGAVDPLDGGVSGTLSLSDGRTDVEVTVATRLLDWNGGDETGFTYRRPFDVALGEYDQGRLAGGQYRLVFSAPGYFSDSLTVNVPQGQIITAQDMELAKATTITAVLDSELDSGDVGAFFFSYRFLHPDGTVLEEIEDEHFTSLPLDLTFFVSDDGTYVLEAWADFHLRTEFPIEVTAGEDVTGLDFTIPRAPLIGGSLTFETGPGAPGTVEVSDPETDEALLTLDFEALDAGYQFYAPKLGDLMLTARAETYIDADLDIVVVTGVDQADADLSLAREPELRLEVAFVDGPGNTGAFHVVGADDTLAIDLPGAGAIAPVFLPIGSYDLSIDVPGYGLWSEAVDLDAGNLVFDQGQVALAAVRADRLRLLDRDGEPVESLSGTVSIPADDFYSYAPVQLEAVDADGRRDLFDLDAKLAALPLTARKLNDVAAPSGFARFLASEDVDDIVTTVDFVDGTASLWAANDAVEVVRVFVGPDVPDPLKDGAEPPTGRFMIGFRPPEPATVVLTADVDSLTADALDQVVLTARLYDSAGNTSPLPDQPVTFLFDAASSGIGAFEQASVTTNADGVATTPLTATGAGHLLITASVVIDGLTLDARLEGPDGDPAPLTIRAQAGPTAAWSFESAPLITGLDTPTLVSAVLVDAYGNRTYEDGVTASLGVEPAGFGSFDTSAPVSDDDGRVRATFTPAGSSGLAALVADGAGFTADRHDFQVREVMIVTDPPHDLEPEGHASFDAVDLTSVVVENSIDELRIVVPFSTNFSDMILHLALETNGDAAGASVDPFEQPVSYGHDLRPDYILTSKLGWDSNYSDLRRWSTETNEYEWWDTDGETYISTGSGEWVEGIKLQDRWVFQTPESISVTIPWSPFGGMPDSVRVEVYVTQETSVDGQTVKRSAFDSCPQDATLDLDFDYNDPEPGDWNIATSPVTLSNWSEPHPIRADFPDPPTISAGTVVPGLLSSGTPFTVSARITDAGDGVGDVLVDLSPLTGSALTRLYDDGLATHGDETAGDGTWSLRSVVPVGAPGGEKALTVSAYDAGNVLAATADVTVHVEAQFDVIVRAEDPIGDDHGPNQEGIEGKYYTYPTNSVFVPGGFDLESLDVYETVAVVNGQAIDMIAFAVKIGDFPDPADPSTADWSPFYGDLNVQKLDILIDTGPGGATRGLPNRRVDVEAWNAWDYAVIMDGWYKAIIPSFGQNTVESWRENAMKTDADIQIIGDFDTDVITAMVSKEALGDPTAEEIAGWGMAVLMSSHDFGGEEVLGGIRWVNESRSEWNFGGGHYTDRDPNIMDLLLVPGAGREDGRPQEEILDFETERAVARLTAGETPCALEMSRQVDTGPPVVRIDRNEGEVVQRLPLTDAPVAFSLEISDDTGVHSAVFSYRGATGGTSWAVTDTMGYAGEGLWTVDIPQAWIDTALVVSPLDGARYLEFQVEARDFGTAEENFEDFKTTTSPVATLQLDPAVDSLWIQGSMASGDVVMRHVDGSVLAISDRLRGEILEAAAADHPAGIDADSLATIASLGWEIAQPSEAVKTAPSIPAGLSVDAFRSIALDLGDDTWTTLLDGRQPSTFDLTLHYLDSAVPGGRDEQKIGLYEYHASNGRWVLVGGNVNADANQVTASVNHEGVYGLFWTEELDYDPGEVISGIEVSPNPFSPNGDGLYDETSIGFYLSQEATVTVEVYNIDGKIKRRLMQTFPFGGDATEGAAPQRSSGLIWDGTDENGKFVPYGIYVLRLIVTYNQAGGQRTIRSNHPVAVIR